MSYLADWLASVEDHLEHVTPEEMAQRYEQVQGAGGESIQDCLRRTEPVDDIALTAKHKVGQ